MARAIDHDRFAEAEYVAFAERLRANLAALRMVLARPGFGFGDVSLGAELELCIADGCGRPLGVNRDILRSHLDPRLSLELDRFNLEYNLTPVPARGTPFGTMERELVGALGAIDDTAQRFGGQIVPVGILPTITAEDLERSALTDFPRYRALNEGLRRARQGAFAICIDGADPLVMKGDDITLEGANTSFQLHLRVNPEHFAATYNAAQLVTPLAVAVAGNSPIFCGHRLWEETRIALFKQSLDVRDLVEGAWRPPARVTFGHGWVREGAFELFAEAASLFPCIMPICGDEDPVATARSGAMPQLIELRLQQGTVWQWNRAIYDPTNGGHLRIEMRALPAGPTPIDMVANAAFLVGLTIGMRSRIDEMIPGLPFRYADWNFHRAAQRGLEAKLLWPHDLAPSPRLVPVRELVDRYLPLAEYGLDTLGIDASESARLLAVIRARLETGTTGARWLRRTFEQCLDSSATRAEALSCTTLRYAQLTRTGAPVGSWPID